MAKIKVELEVPKNCAYCRFFDLLSGRCTLFCKILEVKQNFDLERCGECKQAEVQNAEDKG